MSERSRLDLYRSIYDEVLIIIDRIINVKHKNNPDMVEERQRLFVFLLIFFCYTFYNLKTTDPVSPTATSSLRKRHVTSHRSQSVAKQRCLGDEEGCMHE
jgi:hypothetical protein